jgi:phage-related protein
LDGRHEYIIELRRTLAKPIPHRLIQAYQKVIDIIEPGVDLIESRHELIVEIIKSGIKLIVEIIKSGTELVVNSIELVFDIIKSGIE